MRIYIVRHGQAGAAASDSVRTLSAEGRAEVAKLGVFIARAGIRVDAVWHSPKIRARETAQLLVETGKLGGALEERAGLLPEDDPADVASELEVTNEDVCVVGHMPHVSYLVSLLVAGSAGPLIRFETAAMVCLEREALGAWRIVWHVSPTIL